MQSKTTTAPPLNTVHSRGIADKIKSSLDKLVVGILASLLPRPDADMCTQDHNRHRREPSF